MRGNSHRHSMMAVHSRDSRSDPNSDDEGENDEEAFVDPHDVVAAYDLPEDDDDVNSGDVMEDDDRDEDLEEPETLNVQDDAAAVMRGHTDSVYAVAISGTDPDVVASGGGDDRAFLWSVSSGQHVHELRGHTDSIAASNFSADGRLLATGSMDGSVRIWDVHSGACTVALEGPSEAIEWLCWHPRGPALVAGSSDGTAWMWNCVSGQCMQVFSGHSASVTGGSFTPDGKTVVTVSDDMTARIWNPKDGATVAVLSGGLFHSGGISTVAVSGDSSLILTGGQDFKAFLSQVEGGRIRGTLSGHENCVEAVDFCRTMPLAGTADIDGAIRIWDLHTLSLRQQCSHEDGVTRLIWHPSAPLFFTSSVDQTVCLWDGRTGTKERSWKGARQAIVDMAISSDGQTIVVGSDDHCARVFRV
mmetsp:Transcript_20091/g.33498  ORF Transcript_20091/g.33498 Transcript_20091/m.33498 type:complete len:416 (+) Transcript_20091:3-1250(+)